MAAGLPESGHRDHHVGLGGRLAPEDLAHLAARHLGAVALEDRVGAREVDVLEDAERLALRLHELTGLDPALAQRHHLARQHLAEQLGADDVERAALGGHAVAVPQHAERQRPQPRAVAEGHHGVLGHHHGGEGPVQPRHHLGEGVLDALRRVGGEQRGDDLRVGGAAELDAGIGELGVQLDRVDQVAVVRERHLTAIRAPHRLGVLPRRRPRRRVAHVAHRELPAQGAELLLVEHLRHEAEVAHGHDVTLVRGGDARRLLTPVLKREQREVCEPGDVGIRRVHAEDAALVAGTVPIVEDVSVRHGWRGLEG